VEALVPVVAPVRGVAELPTFSLADRGRCDVVDERISSDCVIGPIEEPRPDRVLPLTSLGSVGSFLGLGSSLRFSFP
jgi:hypothetical protein